MYLKKIKNGPKQQTQKKKKKKKDILLVIKVKNCWDILVGALFLGPSMVVAS